MTLSEIKNEIRVQFEEVNRGRRVRTISHYDVAQALREAQMWTQYGFVCGGRVANAYKHPANMAAVYAVQYARGYIALRFGSIDAHQGSSETTWATGCAKNDLNGQRAAFGPRTDFALIANKTIWLTIWQAEKVIADMAKVVIAGYAGLDDVILTREISLAAGNCFTQTDLVARLVGKNEATVKEVASACVRHGYGHLLPYVVRAAKYAAGLYLCSPKTEGFLP